MLQRFNPQCVFLMDNKEKKVKMVGICIQLGLSSFEVVKMAGFCIQLGNH